MEVLEHLAYGRDFLLALVVVGATIYWIFSKNKKD